jgi:hypothetical protein
MHDTLMPQHPSTVSSCLTTLYWPVPNMPPPMPAPPPPSPYRLQLALSGAFTAENNWVSNST